MGEFDVRPGDPSLPYGALSGGNQQKALLAKWFQTEPRLLLLDEPTQGVDVGARQQIYELIRTAARERGMHVLCASSDAEQLAVALRPRDRLRPRARLARARRRRGHEGPHHRAGVRGDGGRGRRGRRVSAAEAPTPRRTRTRALLADSAERYALLAVWGVTS